MDEQLRILKMGRRRNDYGGTGGRADGGHEHRIARKADCRGKEQL